MFKKVFAATLAGLFISAPAFAEVKMNGSFFVKGNYVDAGGVDARAYESDFEVKTNFIVDENTSATLIVEAFDGDWMSAKTAGADSVELATGENVVSGEAQNHLQVTTAKMDHKFGNGFAFSGGIDGAGDTWGTSFADNGAREYFIQGTMALPFGTATVKTEKINETLVDDEDTDAYLLGLSLDAAGFTIKPAVYYVDDQAADKADTKLMVGVSGKVAAFDISSEIVYADNESDDSKTYGVYVDASTTIDSLGVNVAAIYSSYDDDANVGFNTSTEMAIMEIVTDDINIDGVNLIKAGASMGLTDAITASGAVAALIDNADNRDFDGFEANLSASYKASDAVTLSSGVALLDVDAYADTVTHAYAKINVAF